MIKLNLGFRKQMEMGEKYMRKQTKRDLAVLKKEEKKKVKKERKKSFS